MDQDPKDPRRRERDPAEAQALFDFPRRGADLLRALPERFTFDELMDAADRLHIPSEEAVEHLRIMLREELIATLPRGFRKEEAAAKRHA